MLEDETRKKYESLTGVVRIMTVKEQFAAKMTLFSDRVIISSSSYLLTYE